ncbi:hypothetical protein ACFX2A_007163 [Malus domestica]
MRLMEEIVDPLKCVHRTDIDADCILSFEQEPCSCLPQKYLKGASGGNANSKMISARALLPHEIMHYVRDYDLLEVAELQWKAMIEQYLPYLDEASRIRWESDYEAIKSRFKEKGYGDVVTQLVFSNSFHS